MASGDADPSELPASIVEMLEQQDPETVVAIHHYCEQLLEEYELADEIEGRTYG